MIDLREFYPVIGGVVGVEKSEIKKNEIFLTKSDMCYNNIFFKKQSDFERVNAPPPKILL